LSRLGDALRRHIPHEVDDRSQEVNAVGLDYHGIDGRHGSCGQVQMIARHYDGELRFDPLDLGGHNCTIQQAHDTREQ
jgi:hypothetical protein